MMQVYNVVAAQMHPVQAAPRQSQLSRVTIRLAFDAPRAGSAEAKTAVAGWLFAAQDAPRAGSAEAKVQYP